MPSSRARRGLELLVELGVVFVGVLVALAADSWSQGRQDGIRAQGYVRALQSDLSLARASLEQELAETREDLERASLTYALVVGDSAGSDRTGIGLIAWRDMPIVAWGTFEALVSTGDINLLTDSLRTSIVRGYSALEPHVATLDRLYDLGAINVRDHLFNLTDLTLERGLRPGQIPLAVARRSPEVVATFLLHMGMLTNRQDALNGMLEAVTTLEARVSAHVDREP